MRSKSTGPSRSKLFSFTGVLQIICLAALIAPSLASAQDLRCPTEIFGSSMGCTSEDVTVASVDYDPNDLPATCIAGEPITLAVELGFEINANANRDDIAVWIGQGPGDIQLLPAAGGPETCSVLTLPEAQILSDINNVLVVDDTDGDVCYDVLQGSAGEVFYSDFAPQTIEVLCLPDPGGQLTFQTMVTWDLVNSGDACDRTPAGFIGALGNSKCKADDPIVLPVEVQASLTIEKQTLPDATPGTFTFSGSVGGVGFTPFDLSDNGTSQLLGTLGDQFLVTETIPFGWQLDSIVCTNDTTGAPADATVNTQTGALDITLDGTQYDVTCVYTNQENLANFTVNKDFSDNSTASVLMTLTCTSGSITTNPLAATEASPAVFEITGFDPGATCTASEAATPGYTQITGDCENGDPVDGSCTMTNVLNVGSFTVAKNFSDNSDASVNMTLTCTSGTVTTNPVAATEASPAVFEVTGYEPGATCTATEAATPGYTQITADCENGDPINGSCTMVNNLNTGAFTVNKDFSDDSLDSVNMTLTCTSGTVTTNPIAATEASPAVFEVTGYEAGATCTATEAATPGYTQVTADCENGDPIDGSCTMVNNLNTGAFTVNKDFSDDSDASVDMTLTCTSGTVTTNPLAATEASPAIFEVTGFEPGATCTATEAATPGYTQVTTDCENGDPIDGSCTMVNNFNTGGFTVNKDFSDDSDASVNMTLTCTSGTVTTNPVAATEASPAIFEVTGFEPGATCTATEAATPGYTQVTADCENGDPIDGSCTMTNVLTTGSFTVAKSYDDSNTTGVTVTLTCTEGDITTNPLTAAPGNPAIFEVTGYEGTPTCTALESNVPVGYTADNSDCQDNDAVGSTCTINNALNTGNFTVNKTYDDDTVTPVTVNLTCSDGTVTTNGLSAAPGNPAIFEVTGFEGTPTCTALESNVPVGYTADNSDCQDNDDLGGSCTIANSLNRGSFTVNKTYDDDNTTPVTVNLTCSDGTVTTNGLSTEPGNPAIFEVTGFEGTPTCTALESNVPVGYTADNSDCQDNDDLGGSCTIANTLNSGTFTVNKTYDDDNTTPVTITASCSGGGTFEANDLPAAPGAPAEFTYTGFTGDPTCTALESNVPDGYQADNADCQDSDPLDGSCTIANAVNTGIFTVFKTYDDDNTTPVTITASCTGGGTFEANDLPAAPGAPAEFTYTGFTGDPTCTALESDVPENYEADNTDCQNDDPLNGSCTIINSGVPFEAHFEVYKIFMDGNDETPVTLKIQCNNGLPTQQEVTITPPETPVRGNYQAKFVVTKFSPGSMDCTVWEEPIPTGYTPSYVCSVLGESTTICDDGDASPLDDFGTGVCTYTDVDSSGAGPIRHYCTIRNYPDPVEITVTKDWVIAGAESQSLDEITDIKIVCDSEILAPESIPPYEYYLGQKGNDYYFRAKDIEGDATIKVDVVPDYPSSSCYADESIRDNAVEKTSDCGDERLPGMTVSAAGTGDDRSCTMTNTVFFEGIPTLSQYGLAIMALLMLGVGLVGFRRFV